MDGGGAEERKGKRAPNSVSASTPQNKSMQGPLIGQTLSAGLLYASSQMIDVSMKQ